MEFTAATINQALGYATKGDRASLEGLANKKYDLARCVDRYGASIVHYAARAGKAGLIAWLVQTKGLSGSKPANNGATPAHDAAATGQLESLQWLIQFGGCSPNCRDASMATPLHLAARFNKVSVVMWLVESETCDPLDKAKGGIIPLHLAAARGSIDTVRWLSQHSKSTVDKRADNGATPLYFAAQEGHLDCLKFLAIQVEANCRLRAADGMAPIHAAAQMGKLDCLVWLVQDCKIPVSERDNDGATPLHYAAARGHVSVIQWLLTHGASMEKDDLGGTPLHDAAENGQIETIKLLITYGADPNVRDSDGLTPADLAEDCKFNECAAYLSSLPVKPVKQIEIDLSESSEPFSASLVQSAIEVNKQTVAMTPPTVPAMKQSMSATGISTSKETNNIKKSNTSYQIKKMEEEEDEELSKAFKRLHPTPYTNGVITEDVDGIKEQNPQLMEEVRLFDKTKLSDTPVLKRNLQPYKYGKILQSENTSTTLHVNNTSHQQNMTPPTVPSTYSPVPHTTSERVAASAQLEKDSSNEDSKLPLWKRNLMRKRQKEEEQKRSIDKNKDQKLELEKKFSDVPQWKKKILMKKEEERARQKAIEDEKLRIEQEKQAKFDALPEWKKKIILRKRGEEID